MITDGNGVRYGGFADAARELEIRYGKNRNGNKFTKQQIFTWWLRRENNGFPGKHPKNGLFMLAEVTHWYASYVADKGGRKAGKGNK